MKKNFRGVFLVVMFCFFLSGMSLAAQWAKSYGIGTGNETGGISPVVDGTYYLWGDTNSSGAGKNDALFGQLDASGNVTWAKTMGGVNGDWLSVDPVTDGFLVTGTTKSFGTGNPTAAPNTNILWAKFKSDWTPVYQWVFGGAGNESGSFDATTDGGMLFVGQTNSYGPSTSDRDVMIMKIDSAGNLSWKKVLNYGTNDSGKSFIEMADGYLILGRVTDNTTGKSDILLIKMNTSGGVVWKKLLGATGAVSPTMLIKTQDGNCLILGRVASSSTTGSSTKILLVKMGSGGLPIWRNVYGVSGMTPKDLAIFENLDGTFVLSGTLTGSNSIPSILVMKLDATGVIKLQKKLTGSGGNTGTVEMSSPEELLLSGRHTATPAATSPLYDVLYGEIDPTTLAPVPGSVRTFGGSGNDWGFFERASSTNFLLSGYTESSEFGGDPVNHKANIFGLILDSTGGYSGCTYVKSFTLTATTASLVRNTAALTITSPSLTTRTVTGSPTAMKLILKNPTMTVNTICASK